MTSKTINYPEQVKALNKNARERLLSRMSGKLPKRLAKDKLTEDEALAMQLELEDEHLQEWKEKVVAIRAKEAAKKNK